MFGEVFQRGQLLNKDIVLSSEQFGPSKLSQEFTVLKALTDRSDQIFYNFYSCYTFAASSISSFQIFMHNLVPHLLVKYVK